VDDDDTTQVSPAPDTDRGLLAVMIDDTDEWDDTDRDVPAQGTIDTTDEMFADTGVHIVDRPVAASSDTDRFAVTFRPARFKPRATTADEWPPQPREPAIRAPQFRARAFKRAAIYAVAVRPETKNTKKS
jgi:hypothetical protein